MTTTNLKLTIELVPATSWYSNMRSIMAKPQWDTLRRKVYADYHYICGICTASGMLHCHEIWEYDDREHIQNTYRIYSPVSSVPLGETYWPGGNSGARRNLEF